MTQNEIRAMLEETGFPLAYDHFAEGESPDPPFLIFLFPRSHDFYADGTQYHPVSELQVELYTDRKDPAAEIRVEETLSSQGLCFSRTETWIPSEKLYETVYTTEVANGK